MMHLLGSLRSDLRIEAIDQSVLRLGVSSVGRGLGVRTSIHFSRCTDEPKGDHGSAMRER